jgi:hypothetical protein
MATPSTQINYPLTTFVLGGAGGVESVLSGSGLLMKDTGGVTTSYLQTQITSAEATFDISFNQITFQGQAGTAGQVLTTNAGGQASFQNLPAEVTPNLAAVLAVAPDGDAQDQSISNLSALSFNQDTSGAVLALNGLKVAGVTDNVLNFSTPADNSGATKSFSRNYLPIAVAGQVYYLQLFSAL